ncbi:uncharacterized protein BDZ99DRAFT_393162, partial [Mytilinidion resinicola]
MHFQTLLPFVLASLATAHTVPWVKGMYCINGTSHEDAPNTNTAVNPLYNLAKADWWFQHDRGCDAYPPDEGDILELPAGGSFEVEMAHNRAQTTLSYDGKFTSIWPDGKEHPEDWSGPGNPPECITDGTGALHTNNQTMAAGSAFAISYNSELSDVTSENLVVFTVAAHTPWKRLASFSVPAALPACPPGGCHCAWLWVPNGCGQPNMYMAGYRCNVTGATSTIPVAKGQTPVYCPDDASKCVKGAKQMVVWNQ